jgi:GNAT superfamily N-acetyltransferase
MSKIENWDDMYFSTEYKISSSLGARENARYFQEIEGEVFLDDFSRTNKKLIGRLSGIKLLLDEGANDGWDAYSIFDNEQLTLDLGSAIYDFQKRDWNEQLNEKYNYDLIEPNVLFIASIEILPEFQGHKIGTRFIKDFITNFVQGCSIVAIDKEPFYIQTNFDKELIRDEFTEKMNYNAMDEDFEKITYKLLSYFLKIGFDYFPEINEQFVFMCPALKNEKFSKIEFDL